MQDLRRCFLSGTKDRGPHVSLLGLYEAGSVIIPSHKSKHNKMQGSESSHHLPWPMVEPSRPHEHPPRRNKGAGKARSPGPGGVCGRGRSRVFQPRPSHQGTKESSGLKWLERGLSPSVPGQMALSRDQKMCPGLFPTPMSPLPSSPGLTSESVGLPEGLRSSRWGVRTRQTGGQPGEAEPSARPPPRRRGPCVPVLPRPPFTICLFPGVLVCSCDARICCESEGRVRRAIPGRGWGC